MPGPQPTPTAILKARGSWRAKVRADEPSPEPGRPACPTWIVGEARKEWRRIIGELSACGILARVDRAALAIYCESYRDFVEGVRQRASLSDGEYDRRFKRLLSALREIGLSPASRSGVKTLAKRPAEDRDRPTTRDYLASTP